MGITQAFSPSPETFKSKVETEKEKEKIMNASGRAALCELGLSKMSLQILEDGESVAFELSGVAKGTIVVARYTNCHFQLGVFTIHNIGGGVRDLRSFEERTRRVAKRIGAKSLEIMGLEVTNPKLERILTRLQFKPSSLTAPEELGGGTFTGLSRIETVED